MKIPHQKNTVVITFTAIDAEGNELIQRHCVASMLEMAACRIPSFGIMADNEARKFQDACAGMGLFDHLEKRQ